MAFQSCRTTARARRGPGAGATARDRRRRGSLALLLACVAGLAGWGGDAAADHSGTFQLNEPVGPYVLMAWTEPAQPRTDSCRVTVSLLRREGRTPVQAAVTVEAEPSGRSGPRVSVAATPVVDPGGVRAVADLRLPSAGRFIVTVRVVAPEGGGTARFPLDVEAPPWPAWPIAGGLLALLAVTAGWVLRRRRARAP